MNGTVSNIHGCSADVECPTCEQARSLRLTERFVWIVCQNGSTVRSSSRRPNRHGVVPQ